MQTQTEARIEWINLGIHRLRWTPDGLAVARELVRRRQEELEAQGWTSLSSPDDHGVLQQGRGLNGPVVSGARLELRRTA